MADKGTMSNIKNEIDSRKKEKNMVASSLGEPVAAGVAPRDVFLHGLVESLKHGTETASATLVKTVANEAAKKKGETAKLPITSPTPTAPVNETATPVQMSPERDEQMYADMKTMGNKTLAESIQGFSGTNPSPPQAPVINYGGSQYLTSAPAAGAPAAGQINEAALIEGVRQIVNGHLVENLAPILEETIKSTVIEMYAVERIKEVLNENKDLIKSVVYETIRELQKKKKA